MKRIAEIVKVKDILDYKLSDGMGYHGGIPYEPYTLGDYIADISTDGEGGSDYKKYLEYSIADINKLLVNESGIKSILVADITEKMQQHLNCSLRDVVEWAYDAYILKIAFGSEEFGCTGDSIVCHYKYNRQEGEFYCDFDEFYDEKISCITDYKIIIGRENIIRCISDTIYDMALEDDTIDEVVNCMLLMKKGLLNPSTYDYHCNAYTLERYSDALDCQDSEFNVFLNDKIEK